MVFIAIFKVILVLLPTILPMSVYGFWSTSKSKFNHAVFKKIGFYSFIFLNTPFFVYQAIHEPETKNNVGQLSVDNFEISSLPENLSERFEGCPNLHRPVYILQNGVYSAHCLDSNGLVDGPRFQWWADSGRIFRKEYLGGGKLFGPAKSWDSQGRITLDENFGNGSGKDGKNLVYNYQNKKLHVEVWKNGRRVSITETDIE